MIKTGYEIIGMIKDGKAPKKIKLLRCEPAVIDEFNEETKTYSIDLVYCMNDEFEIIEEPKVWKPKEGEEFYYLDLYGAIVRGVVESGSKEFVECLYASGNIFKTEEKVDLKKVKILIYNKLKRYAAEHNTEKIDWNNDKQSKYHIEVYNNDKINIWESYRVKHMNQVYFTSEELCWKAIAEIGEDNIKKLFEEE